jgi:hypothetical protein
MFFAYKNTSKYIHTALISERIKNIAHTTSNNQTAYTLFDLFLLNYAGTG